MRKNKMIVGSTICAFAFAISGFTVQLASADIVGKKVAVSELFLTDYATVQSGYSPDESNLSQTAVFFETNVRDTSVFLKNQTASEFSILLEPVLSGGTSTLRKLSFTFTDVDTLESFDLCIDFEAQANVSVIMGDEQAGIAYYKDELMSMTGIANTAGIYTQYNSMLLPLTFSPDTMCVYVGEGINEKLVWDLSENVNDNKEVATTFNGFEKYTVKMTMHDFVGESSGICVYSLNGYSLDKNIIGQDEAGEPSITAKITKKGLKGKTYDLPKVYAFDLLDGELENIKTEVIDPDDISILTDGYSFYPKKAGIYKLRYEVDNSFNKVGFKEYEIEVLESAPAYSYEFVENPNIPNFSTAGEEIYIPEMHISGGLAIDFNDVALVTVKRNNVVQVGAINRASGFFYKFNTAGSYDVIYHLPDNEIVFEIEVAKGETNVELTETIEKSYNHNTYIDLSNAQLMVDGIITDFKLEVTDPIGRRFTNKQFICNEVGLYILTATSVEDFTRKVTYSFSVINKVQDLFGGNADVITSYGKSMVTQENGVLLYSQSAGSSIKYNQTIDLTKYVNQVASATGTTDNTKYAVNAFQQKYGDNRVGIRDTATPLIDFSVQPYAYDKMAMTGVNIVLTDINDANNKITINVLNLLNDKKQAYIRAAAGNQRSAGLEPGAANKDNLFHIDNWGHIVRHTFAGSFGTGNGYDMVKSRIALFYDNEEKRLLVGEKGANEMCLIVDFDDPRLCGGEVWNGFSTGEVTLSIELIGMIYEKAGIVVYAIDGTDLSTETVRYTTPNIIVNASSLEGIKGGYFRLPTVAAYDSSGAIIGKIRTQVVYVASNGKEYDVNVKDGKFDTVRAGTYYIRYFAVDKYGKENKEELEVYVYSTYANFIVSADIPESYKTGKTGQSIQIFSSNDIEIINSLGGESVEICVYYNDEIIALHNGVFVPKQAGVYTVEYVFQDGVGRNTTLSYEVDIEVETELVVSSPLPVYKGFIEGNTYQLYDVYVIDYASGSSAPIKADVYIGGEKWEDGEYTPTVSEIEAEDSTEIIRYTTIEYKYGDQLIKSYYVPIRNVYKEKTFYIGAMAFASQSFEIDRYFYAESGVDISVNDSISMIFTGNRAKVDFLQPLASNGLNVIFDIIGKNDKFTAIDSNINAVRIYITDSQDSNKEVLLLFVEEGGVTNLYVNGEMAIAEPSGALNGTSQDKFSFTLNTVSSSIVNTKNGAVLALLKTFANGDDFTGFSDKVYVSFEIERKLDTKSAALNVFSINGQNFSNAFENDTVAPSIKINGSIQMSYTSGSIMSVPVATASDVLSNVMEVVVSVTLNGVAVKDVKGRILENVVANEVYEVLLSSVGQYMISYRAKDSRGVESVPTDYVIRSVIEQKPVINVSSEVPKTVKVGTEIILPTFTVTYLENNEDNLNYGVYITPSNEYCYLDGNKFTPTKVGKYKVRYFALDVYGNYAIWETTIEVTA